MAPVARAADPFSLMRLGYFGGTFDPVHRGHIRLAQEAVSLLGLDRLTFLPAARNPLKGVATAPTDHRLAMLRLAIAGIPSLAVDDRELRRPPPSYTIETVTDLAREHPAARLFWLLGADAFADLARWREPDRLAALLTFAVLPREGFPLMAPAIPGLHWLALPAETVDLSSTLVRNRLRQGQAVDNDLPPEVGTYIRDNSLYTTPSFESDQRRSETD